MEGSLEYILKNLAEMLLANNLKVVVAESCTGGGVAKAMTDLPGSSDWFERGYVTYSNDSKIELLGVASNTLEEHGAVSTETATEMAEGAIINSHAQISVAVTGIAGPEGGTAEKPVGTVCFAWSAKGFSTMTTTLTFSGDRTAIRQKSILMAIQGISELVEKLGGGD